MSDCRPFFKTFKRMNSGEKVVKSVMLKIFTINVEKLN